MDELGKIKRVVEKQAPISEVLLVLDATTGQNGLAQAEAFIEHGGVTGLVLTKLDGSAKGGSCSPCRRRPGCRSSSSARARASATSRGSPRTSSRRSSSADHEDDRVDRARLLRTHRRLLVGDGPYGDQGVEVVLEADADLVSTASLDAAATLVGELELVDDELRSAFVSQLDSGGTPVMQVPRRAARRARARPRRSQPRRSARLGRPAGGRAALALARARRPPPRGRRPRARRSRSSSTARARGRSTSGSSPRSTWAARSSTCASRGDRRRLQLGGIRSRLQSKDHGYLRHLTASPRPSRTSAPRASSRPPTSTARSARSVAPARRRRRARRRQGVHRARCASAPSATRSTRR